MYALGLGCEVRETIELLLQFMEFTKFNVPRDVDLLRFPLGN